MKIAIGCDHGAYELKEIFKKHFDGKGIEYKDCGTYSLESVHYPVYAKAVCKAVQKKEADFGILLCSTGIGMSIAASRSALKILALVFMVVFLRVLFIMIKHYCIMIYAYCQYFCMIK